MLVGSVLIDLLLYVERLPERVGDTLASGWLMSAGGGFNLLTSAARLGMPVAYGGRSGAGIFGQLAARNLAEAGIELLLPPSAEGDTGFDVGLVEADGERTFVTSPGVEARLTRADLESLVLRAGDAVYVSGYDLCYPESGAALGAWWPALPPVCLAVMDPGPLAGQIPSGRLEAVLRRTDILSLNAREAQLLGGGTIPSEAAPALRPRLAPGGVVVVRSGAQGCWVSAEEGEALHSPARAARVVDTTGAGDTHVAAMLARLAAGEDLMAAAWAANVAASLAVERAGPATGPSAEEFGKALSAAAPEG
jgi:sugar/nucleoside kinase (ribokinase family)